MNYEKQRKAVNEHTITFFHLNHFDRIKAHTQIKTKLENIMQTRLHILHACIIIVGTSVSLSVLGIDN